jgi:hypothetical protein
LYAQLSIGCVDGVRCRQAAAEVEAEVAEAGPRAVWASARTSATAVASVQMVPWAGPSVMAAVEEVVQTGESVGLWETLWAAEALQSPEQV